MARFDVYPHPRGGPGALLDVQANLLDHLRTRTVVPLIPIGVAPPAIRDLNPVLEIEGVPHIMLTQAIVAIPAHELRLPIISLRDKAEVIVRALDVLLTGI